MTIVGVINTIQEASTSTTFVVDDGTSQIDVRIWLDPDDQNDYNVQQKQYWK